MKKQFFRMTKLPFVTQEELKRALHYDPDTGIFTRLSGHRGKGRQAGWMQSNSCGQKGRYIMVNKISYPASHLAFFYMTGEWAPKEMDHIDRNAANDKWSNLRPATRQQNEANKGPYKNNKLGLKGVYFHRANGKFVASIRRNGIRKSLGCFTSAEDAARCYREASQWS